jgi:ATP-binding cassette subfamily B protein
LKKGETLGIIGATGSGKSTVANLLMRLYDTDQGNIYIEGEHIRSIPFGLLHKRFGVVFQNDTIFEDSISENIRMGRELSEEEIQNAVLYAKAKEFVETEGRGYQEQLNIKGANLSGGQKQRILIARALAAHPDILILDDSSSALDYKTDAALRKELKEHFQDTTTVVIAQRVSSIMNAEHIMVLDDGKMIGYGTHDELMKNCNVYREIGESQMGEIAV